MSVMRFLKAAARSSLGALGARLVRLNGEEAQAVVDTVGEGQGGEFGGGGEELGTTLLIRREDLKRLPHTGDVCELDGVEFEVAGVEAGEAMVSLTLEERERRG